MDDRGGVTPTERKASPSTDLLAKLQATDSIMDVNILAHVKSFLSDQVGGRPEDVVRALSEGYRGLAQMCNLVATWLVATGMTYEEVAELLLSHFKAFTRDVYDPKMADCLFQVVGAEPDWLPFMIHHSEWRGLLCELAETHRNSLFLNFAIRGMSSAGYQSEIVSLATASTYFPVFNNVLRSSLLQLVTMDESSLTRALPDFLLQRGSDAATSKRIVRLYQEVQEFASTVRHKPAVQVHSLVAGLAHSSGVGNAIVTILSDGKTNTADVMKLYAAYHDPRDDVEAPPADILRHPSLFGMLIDDLYNFNRPPLPARHEPKYVWLLAYAATASDASCSSAEVMRTARGLQATAKICKKNPFGSELQDEGLPKLRLYLSWAPVIGMGLLRWLKLNLTSAAYYRASFFALCMPIHLKLLKEIVYLYPLLRPMVVGIICEALNSPSKLDPTQAIKVSNAQVNILLYCLQCGCVLPVLEGMMALKAKIDASIVRHFVCQFLSVTQGPYDMSVQGSVVNLLHASLPKVGTSDAFAPGEKKRVVSFLECVSEQLDGTLLGLRDEALDQLRREDMKIKIRRVDAPGE